MLNDVELLDLAVDAILEKATANTRAHMAAATMTQKDYDKHADALAHHASAIMHYRAQPAVQKYLQATQALVPHRAYINKPIKMENAHPTELKEEHLNHEHPAIKGMDQANKQKLLGELNGSIKHAHTLASHPQVEALKEHGARFLAHLVAMTELHNLEKKGAIPHSQFSANLHAPEITDKPARYEDSKYRGSSHAGGGKYTTQSVTKHGGALWNPALPEHTALEENSGHKSVGKPKELYPFHEIKVNGEPLKMKTFERDPRKIHTHDYMTNLSKEHEVRHPETGERVPAMGSYYGSASLKHNLEGAEKVGLIKKTSDDHICSYFPDVTYAHYVFAKNLMKAMNPFASMTDEEFGDYAFGAVTRDLRPAEQAVVIAESVDRLEKARKSTKDKTAAHEADTDRRRQMHEREHAKGVADVISGKVTPLPMTDAGERTEKEGEKRNELEDINQTSGFKRKRSPYVAPAHVFTDDTYSKIDPEKYKKWAHGDMEEQDLRNEHATYQNMVRHNPDAQARHKGYVDLHREQAQSGISSATHGGKSDDKADNPVKEHAAKLKQLGEDLKSGKITHKEFAEQNQKAMTERSKAVTHQAGQAELTPDEKLIQERVDPNYKPRRLGGEEAAAQRSERELTDIAGGKMPSRYLADPDMFGAQDEHSGARAREIVGSGEGTSPGGSVTSSPSPVRLVSDHPGFKAYLMLKDHLLSHYKDPAIREYVEGKINQHENNPNFDVAKLAGMFGMLHRSQEQAMRAGRGHKKLMQDIVGATSPIDEGVGVAGEDNEPGKGHAIHPESMMTPDQKNRLQEVRQHKPGEAPAPQLEAQVPQPPAGKVRGMKDMSPEELAAITARANKPKGGMR